MFLLNVADAVNTKPVATLMSSGPVDLSGMSPEVLYRLILSKPRWRFATLLEGEKRVFVRVSQSFGDVENVLQGQEERDGVEWCTPAHPPD